MFRLCQDQRYETEERELLHQASSDDRAEVACPGGQTGVSWSPKDTFKEEQWNPINKWQDAQVLNQWRKSTTRVSQGHAEGRVRGDEAPKDKQ